MGLLSRAGQMSYQEAPALTSPPPALHPSEVRGHRDTSIHPSAAVYSHRAADVGDGEATAAHRHQHVFSHPEMHVHRLTRAAAVQEVSL